MGFHLHRIHKCHTCKRRRAAKGPKKGGSFDDAKKAGWVFVVASRLGSGIWLCPACRRKHLPAGAIVAS
jgi:hypothetical protein